MANEANRNDTTTTRTAQPAVSEAEQSKLGFSSFTRVEANSMSGCTKTTQSSCGINYRQP